MGTNFEKILFDATDEQCMTNFNINTCMVDDMHTLIRDWYKSQPHLPQDALDDHFLQRYLAASKYSVENTKKKIDCFYTSRSIFPEVFGGLDPFNKDIIDSNKACGQLCMPNLSNNKTRIVIVRFPNLDPKLYIPMMTFKYSVMLYDLRNAYDKCCDDEYIWDLTHVKFGHIIKTTPTMIKKMFFIVQNAYASRIKGIHILNCPSFAKNSVNIIKSILKKKIVDRIYFHDSLEELHKYINPEYLPIDFGGTSLSCEKIIENTINTMQSDEWKAWFLKANGVKSDESKRPKKTDDIVGDMLGIMGSFRKLDID